MPLRGRQARAALPSFPLRRTLRAPPHCTRPLPSQAHLPCLRPTANRRSVLGLKFVPVFMGSAFKNRGVQLLLDGVQGGLPLPLPCRVVPNICSWSAAAAAGAPCVRGQAAARLGGTRPCLPAAGNRPRILCLRPHLSPAGCLPSALDVNVAFPCPSANLPAPAPPKPSRLPALPAGCGQLRAGPGQGGGEGAAALLAVRRTPEQLRLRVLNGAEGAAALLEVAIALSKLCNCRAPPPCPRCCAARRQRGTPLPPRRALAASAALARPALPPPSVAWCCWHCPAAGAGRWWHWLSSWRRAASAS